MSYTGRIDIAALALDPIHHGAGTEGNTVVLRRQEIAREDGTLDLVPFISGNSIRHMIRNAGVLFALEAMGVQPESLSKGVVDLLFSGGSLGGKNSPTTAQAKRIEQMFPILSLMGYSAGNRIESGRLEVHHLHLVCEENMWRKPDSFASERWFVPASAQTGSQFGTRHDASRSASASRFLALPASTLDATVLRHRDREQRRGHCHVLGHDGRGHRRRRPDDDCRPPGVRLARGRGVDRWAPPGPPSRGPGR